MLPRIWWPNQVVVVLALALLVVAPHTVKGSQAASVSSVSIAVPASGDSTFKRDDPVDVTVTFGGTVDVSSNRPTLSLGIGSSTRTANYASGAGTSSLVFRYTVQASDMDEDGISVAANALCCTGRVLVSGTSTSAVLGLGSHAISNSVGHRVDGSTAGPPVVSSVEFLSRPSSDSTYGLGEAVWVFVDFDRSISITGEPQLALTVGSQTRQARYSSANSTGIWFYYYVQVADMDADGISIGTNALAGATIKSSDGSVDAVLGLGEHAVMNDAAHRVNGSLTTAPSVSGVFVLWPYGGADSTYTVGEEILIQVSWDRVVVVTGIPQLALTIGSQARQASYSRGSGQPTTYFHYYVQASDMDSDGISIGASALTLNGGTIALRGSSATNANLDLGSHAISNDPRAKVNGSQGVGVTGVSIAAPTSSDSTFTGGDSIDVTVTFSGAVDVSENTFQRPFLRLGIGLSTVAASYVSGHSTSSLVFRYVVQASDMDADGISVPEGALAGSVLVSGSSTTNAGLGLGSHAIANSAAHKVDGGGAEVAGVSIAAPTSRDSTFKGGDPVDVTVTFSRTVDVSSSRPTLSLGIGSATRTANYVSGHGTSSLVFRYAVQASDVDANGISVAADALCCTGRVLVSGRSTNAGLGLGSHAILNSAAHKVDGSTVGRPVVRGVQFENTPVSASTYELGEEITVSVEFDRPISATGSPRLALTIGSQTRQANYYAYSSRSLHFVYDVQASDVDADGISVGTSALSLNGGTITSSSDGSVNAVLGLGSHAVTNDAARKVNGGVATAPSVRDMGFVSTPASDSTYELGERIDVTVFFDRGISYTGAPQLALTIGSRTRQANIFFTSSTKSLQFRYYVQVSDMDSDGISIGATALTLNGGTIALLGSSATNANLALWEHTNDAAHKVNGSLATAPSVSDAHVFDGGTDLTYTLGEEVVAQVDWDRVVEVTGTPQLALTIGSRTRQASYYDGSGTQSIFFRYYVQASDMDSDGISVGASALSLNGGTIALRGSSATSANLGLGSHAISNDPRAKVNGGQGVGVTGVSIAAPASGDSTFKGGDPIDVTVTFSGAVDVSSPRPFLRLGIGSSTRTASYVSGTGTSSLLFRYAVQSSDADADGISVAEGALCCLGRVLVSGSSTTDAGLGLGSHAISNSGAHKVDGSTAGAPVVSGVRFTSMPASDSTYELGEAIEVLVEFDRPISSTGSPQLALTIASQTRQANIFFTSSTKSLQFRYDVHASDMDADGISIGARALALNGGTITLRGSSATNANLGLGSHAVTNDAAHKVNGSLATAPSVSRVEFTSTPASDSTYELGEQIDLLVDFDRGISVTGAPQLALTIGSRTQQASANGWSSSGRLWFRYFVQASDMDSDGISVGASALSLNGGTIALLGSSATNANLGLGEHAVANDAVHKVNGSLATAPSVSGVFVRGPYGGADSTYTVGEEILIQVSWDRVVVVTGTPQLALTIGSQTRQASYSRGSGQPTTYFHYYVQASDMDSDGISIGASALSLNGGTIALRGSSATNANLDLGSSAISNFPFAKVNGSQGVGVTGVSIAAPASGDSTFKGGDPIDVTVTFSGAVDVSSNRPPILSLGIGSSTRTASYVSGTGTSSLLFRYAVQSSDADADGISVAEGALCCLGRVLVSGSSTTDAGLGLGSHAISNSGAHKVDGSTAGAPVVSGVEFASTPASDSTYGLGELVYITVEFDRPISSTGSPQLALTIGSQTRQARSWSYGRDRLSFRYDIQASDMDSDGISIGASALSLNGGTITLQSDRSVNAVLGFGEHAVANDAVHKVNGSLATAPSVSGVGLLWPYGGTDSTYTLGEEISIRVHWDRAVEVTGTPQLVLAIGSRTRQASYDQRSSSITGTEFRYYVQASDMDSDGISVGASALSLNGGTIALRGSSATSANLGLGNHAISNYPRAKVNGGQGVGVTGVSIAAPASGDSTFKGGDAIDVTVTFRGAVDVSSNRPFLRLGVGSSTRRAGYVSGHGTSSLVFRYTVQSSDADADGISVAEGALCCRGRVLVSGTDTDAGLGLGSHAISNSGAHKVDGSTAGAPVVSGVRFTSMPASDSTYELGEAMEISVEFDRSIRITGEPQLALTIGSQTRQANLIGWGYDDLRFSYAVQASDVDADGISVGASALALNGGTITSFDGSANAALGLGEHAVANDGAHKVNGGVATAPSVSGVEITSTPRSDSTYERGERIDLTVAFDRPVAVTGAPQLALTIGLQTRQAAYASGTGTKSLVFQYTVTETDTDSDGLSVGVNALALNSGTINLAAAGTTAATLGLGTHVITNAAAHKVDGNQATAPSVDRVAFLRTPTSDSTYTLGEEVRVAVYWDRAVVVMGTPQLALTIGSQTRQASYYAGGDYSTSFRYYVQASDTDSDGISVGASALTLNGGTINDAATGSAAVSDLGAHAVTNDAAHKVNGGMATAPSVNGVNFAWPRGGADSTYTLGQEVLVGVFWDRLVEVTGTPQLGLTIGSQTRQASYYAGGGYSTSFRYYVQASDMDSDGIGVGASALSLNGGMIALRGSSATNANLGLGEHAISNDLRTKVDGSQVLAPFVREVRVSGRSCPETGDTCELGDKIVAYADYRASSTPLEVTGTPQMAIVVGGQTRYANYDAIETANTTAIVLYFSYFVQSSDRDENGIHIPANALRLNGGTIRIRGTQTDASIAHAGTPPDADTKVDGSRTSAPEVRGVVIASRPASGDTYELSENIRVQVRFSRGVAVTGTPRLALTVGSQTRQASYASGTDTERLEFSYAVQSSDTDVDGISVGASALSLNGGTITLAGASTAASLSLGAHAIANDAAHKVDGSQGPPGVSAVSIGSPPVGDTFERGDTIVATVTFNKAVDVTGAPQLALAIGSTTKQAAYASGTGTAELVFRYVVASGDADADGLSIAADALSLNGGTIDVAGGTVDAALGLDSHAIVNSAGHKVAGGTFTAASVSGVAVSSAPAAGDSTYGLGERIEATVTFSRRVSVTGTPRLALFVGTDTVQADYASGTGTKALAFGYTVVASDTDADGIGIGAAALTLNGGAIADARDGATAASLGLGAHAIANDAAHKVAGSQGPPGVSAVSIGSPPVGDTFERGDTVITTVTFNKAVDVTGAPQLALAIGSATRQAAYASGTGTAELVFRYVVASGDADADGISIAAGALALNGGTIDVAGGTVDAALGLDSHAIVNSAGHKVAGGTFTASSVSGVAMSSSPAAGDSTYGLGERIEATVTFSRRVSVTGTPRLALFVGADTVQADYASGTGTTSLVFGYTVVASDTDADGIGIGAAALALNGGAIADARDGATAASLGLGAHAIANDAAHKVDGSQGPPGVSAVTIGSPPVGDTFERGDTIVATVTFNKAVDVTGAPQLALAIGSATKQGAYASGTGTTELVFRYMVASGDADADGLSIAADALALNGGTIDVAGGTVDAVLGLDSHAIVNSAGHKVAGGTFTAASVSGVAVSSAPAAGDSTYVLGERIEATVTFSRRVSVTGTPRLALTIGSRTRQAAYASGTGSTALVFGYTVVAADADMDGISIGAAALALNGGAIADARDGATAASLGLGANAIANDAAHKVDGSQGPPGVSAVSIGSPPVGDTFERGDTVITTVTFNKAVDVTGAPQLALAIGSATKQAAYASGTGTAELVFRYVVVSGDADADGISIAADALGLNGGTIDVAGGTTDAVLGLGGAAVTNSAGHKVAGGTLTATSVSGVAVSSSPAAGDSTYVLGERIEATVTFSRRVSVTGTPLLALTMGSQTRQATYASGTGTKALVFGYTVVASDTDMDGLGIGAAALALNGGAIADARDGSTAASLGLGAHAIANDAAHKVDGSQGPPGVSAVTIGLPPVGDTFERGDTIVATVTFNKAVDVTGAPQLALAIGSATRQAAYASGTGTTELVFRYVVASGDADPDGLSIAADALGLNGGTIDVAGGTTDAVLGLGGAAVTNSAGHKVAGGTFTAAEVSGASITSTPAGASTYGLSERIEVTLTFNRAVDVTGTPQLALEIGAQTRQADYASGTGTRSLVFGYVVVAGDADANGIAVGAGALTLNGGTVADARDGTTAANLGLGSNAIADAAAHKVDGSQGPPGVSGLLIGSPDVSDTFERGDTVIATVTFNKAVDVTGTPQLALSIGSATKQAAYASGSGTVSLQFRYLVVQADVDTDGVSIGADALSLNGGTIDVAGGTTDAVLDLGAHAVSNSAGHKVAGGSFTASSVTGVGFASSPGTGDTYGLGERIKVEVAFARAVAVTGVPQLALTVGSQTRQADYASGAGTKTLTFSYTVVIGDADSDGIGIGTSALALNGGAIADARDGSTAAGLGLGSNAIANDAAHKVDGNQGPPGVSGLVIGSPDVSDTFERGEQIEVTVTFNKAVDVTGTPQLALTIGSATRQADYASGTGTTALVFRYTVQSSDADTDGISIAADALGLNGGTIDVSGGTTDAVLGLGASAIVNSANHKVAGGTFTAASVSAVAVTSEPSSDSTYGRTEQIDVEVSFTRRVTVTGAPQLALTIGSTARHAAYTSGTGSNALTFRYTVTATDADTDGLSIGASALALNGGTISDARGGTGAAASLGLGANAIADAAAHKVDGNRGPPGVTSLSINSPTVGDTFERGETIEVSLVFNRSVDVTGTPQLALAIGAPTRQAAYASGTGTDTLVFGYVVAANDADSDGISIGTSALALSGGTIKVAGGTLDATLALPSAAAVSNSAGHKVTGTFTTPAVSGVMVSSAPSSGQTYQLGESIEVKVAFSRPVMVTGAPLLALSIGSATRQAGYESASSTADTLAFGYSVRPEDADADGISIAGSALTLNGGAIADVRPGATPASLGLGTHAIANAAAHKVAGSQGPPGVVGLSVAAPPVSTTFERGDTIVATVTFNKAVDVSGTPQLALSIGSATKQASYASGTGTASLIFRYVVVSGDADADGISISSNALALNAGAIDVAGGTTDALLSLERQAFSNSAGLRVSGATFSAASVSGVAIASAPASDSTYGLSEQIEVEVTFVRAVGVSGTPQLALTIGTETRQAVYVRGTGTPTLAFRYAVTLSDSDANGLSIGSGALGLNGGTINDARDGSTAAGLALGAHAIRDASAHKVDGSRGPPGVAGVSIGAPPVGDTFERGDTVVATVTFNKAVDVTGAPQLALAIGSATKQANYASGGGTASLVFRYLVVQADVDADGISIGASALALNGGTVDVSGGTVDAQLSLGAHAIANSTNHKVAGGTFTASSPDAVTITTAPASSGTYGLGERIEVAVMFPRTITVTGVPQLALTVGTETRQADYASGTGTKTLTFAYTVAAGDADTDGIGVAAGALALNGGAVADGRDGTTAAGLGLGTHAIANAAGHRVDATRGPPGVMSVSIAPPPVGMTFERGDEIVVTVTFNKAVRATGTPSLALGIGSATRQADYADGSGTEALAFRYVVASGDADADGLSIGAAALSLNGGTIKAWSGAVDAVLSLGGHAISNSASHKVAGGTFTASSPSGARLTSAPASGDTYGLSERVEVEVAFERPVVVTGTPQLAVGIGSAARQAGYASGSGTTALRFAYVVAAGDADTDGISVGASALALNGGTIVDARDGSTAAGLGLGSNTIANASAHKVDGSVEGSPVVAGVRMASRPSNGRAYGLGEEIRVAVRFDRAVAVTDVPQLALTIGSQTRQAAYAGGSGTAELEFAYLVQASDADANGIGMSAGALSLNGGTLVVAGGSAAAALSLGGHAIANARGHAVAGAQEDAPVVTGVRMRSSPATGATYALSERVAVAVTFGRPVTVTGTPQLALGIGTATRPAAYASGSGTPELTFGYVVAATDTDADGVSVAADALSLNGGAITIAGGSAAAALALGAHALSNVAGHLVDGSVEAVPAVAGVTPASTPIGGAYERGETIRVHVRFDRAVVVTGTPELALTIGAESRMARFVRVVGYGAGASAAMLGEVLEFAYVVQASDADADGIGVDAGALALNGGAITLHGGTAVAGLSLGSHARSNLAGHVVDGSVVSPPVVADVEVSMPGESGHWRSGEVIELAIVFDRPVLVAGRPQLALSIGSSTARAELASASGRRVEFSYQVRSGDRAPNGIGLPAGALDLNGGEIVSAADGSTAAALSLGSHAFANDPSRPVDGGGRKPRPPGRPPEFEKSSYAFELAENMAGPVVLGTIKAVDPDEGDYRITYVLSKDGGGLFDVDQKTGEVRYMGGGEDHESKPDEHVLVAAAMDVSRRWSEAEIVVSVTNVNEVPSFAQDSWAFELAENTPGPVVLGTVEASDPDEGDAVSYRLASGGGGLFAVDASSGEVRYVGGGEDYESVVGVHELVVEAIDKGGLQTTAAATVTVADVGEAPWFGQDSWAFELAENTPGPVVLGTVEASDPDDGDAVSYRLVPEGDGLFAVDASSGEVRYAGDGEDYETGPVEHALVVEATDGDSLSARADVVVTVTDVNEAPSFAQDSWAFELAENQAGPVVVGVVEASDVDAGDVLAYSLVSGGGGLFEVDASSGEVRYVGGGEDYESGSPTFELGLRATDEGGLTAEAGATVAVLDVNEAPEAVGSVPSQRLEVGGAPAQQELSAYFRDPDGDVLAYAVESSASEVASVAVTSGVLEIAPVSIGEAVVTVTATDSAGLSAVQTVDVVVEASRSERARVLKGVLATFGRSVGTEAVDVIGGRLGMEPSGAGGFGRSHLQLGGRAVGCDNGFVAAQRAGASAGPSGATEAWADSAVRTCGWRGLARSASGLLGLRIALPQAGTGGGAHAAGPLDAATLLFGAPTAFGAPGAASGGVAGFAGGGDYQGQQEPTAGEPGDGSVNPLSANPLSGRDVLERSSFQLSFGGGSDRPDDASAAPQDPPVRPGWTVWGRTGVGGFDGRPADGLQLTGGRTRSAHLGLDYRFASGLLVGLAGARTRFETGFESVLNGAGSVAANLTSVHPYVHWSSGDGLGLWALAGVGFGGAVLKETAGGRFDADIGMLMGALGVRRELAGGFALKADAFSVDIRSDAVADMAGVTARAQRVRLASEVAKDWALGGEASLRTRLELGGRLDRGDAEAGLGAETGAEAAFSHAATGLSVGLRGRTLLAHQAAGLREWGAGFSLRIQPGGQVGNGLSFSVEPTWGRADGGAGTLWRQGTDAFDPAASPCLPSRQGRRAHPQGAPSASASGAKQSESIGWTPGRMAMELGYGLALDNGATITPFGRWSQDVGSGRRLNVGTRFSLLGVPADETASSDIRFFLHLFGEHASSPLQPSQRRIGLAGAVKLRQ